MVQGEVTIIKTNILTGEVVEEITTPNTITTLGFDWLLAADWNGGNSPIAGTTNGYYDPVANFSGTNKKLSIVIGGWNQLYDASVTNIWNALAIGEDISGVTEVVLVTGTTPYIKFEQKFSAPAADRTIYTIGLTRDGDDTTDIPAATKRMPVQAYVRLVSPCTQTTLDQLTIIYRLQFPYVAGGATSNLHGRTFAARHVLGGGSRGQTYPGLVTTGHPSCVNVSPFSKHITYAQNKLSGTRLHGRLRAFENAYSTTRSFSPNTSLRKRVLTTAVASTSEMTGHIFGSAYYFDHHGYNTGNELQNLGYFSSKIRRVGGSYDSPIQSIFSHKASATTPFYVGSDVAVGTGTIQLNGTNWTNPDWNKMFRIDITGSGIVGAATYQLKVRNVFGFANNTYVDQWPFVPYLVNSSDTNVAHCGGVNWVYGTSPHFQWAGVGTLPYNGDGKTIIGYDTTWVGRLDLSDGDMEVWRSSSTPALGVTSVGQVEVASTGEIWVSCRNTGLYKISADGLTITKYDNTTTGLTGLTSAQCYGVSEGASGKIWAVFNGGLCVTTDGGTTWTVYNAASSPTFNHGSFGTGTTVVQWIQCDKNSAEDRCAIGYDTTPADTSSIINVAWWRASGAPAGMQAAEVSQIHNETETTYPGKFEKQPIETFQKIKCASSGLWGTVAHANNGGNSNKPCWFNFGASSPSVTNAIASFTHRNMRATTIFVKDSAGADAILWRNDQDFSSTTYYGIAKQGGTVVNSQAMDNTFSTTYLPAGSYTGAGGGRLPESLAPIKAYLGKGVILGFTEVDGYPTFPSQYRGFNVTCLSGHYPTTPLPTEFRKELWTEYGWDGSNWVKDHAGSKTTHLGYEDLVDGVQIKFDDLSGSQTFNATDYFTVGIVDGMWADGSITFSHQACVHYAPTVTTTDLQTNTIPGTTTTIGIGRSINGSTLTMVDATNMTVNISDGSVNSTGAGTPSTFTAKIRSSNLITGNGSMFFSLSSSNSQGVKTVGLSSGNIGQPLNEATIDYGFFIDTSSASDVNDSVWIRENGVNVFKVSGAGSTFDSDVTSRFKRGANEDDMTFGIIRTGTTITYRYKDTDVYTSTVPSTTDLHIDIATSYPTQKVAWISLNCSYDTYGVYMGNSGTLTGRYDPDFYTIDTDRHTGLSIKIDGVEAARLSNGDWSSTVNAGQVSLFTGGFIRTSPADAGKTITANYTYIKKRLT